MFSAALFIGLNTLANRKKVVISRGELVQIGGGFRIPDILNMPGDIDGVARFIVDPVGGNAAYFKVR